jgi:hypothetical protein
MRGHLVFVDHLHFLGQFLLVFSLVLVLVLVLVSARQLAPELARLPHDKRVLAFTGSEFFEPTVPIASITTGTELGFALFASSATWNYAELCTDCRHRRSRPRHCTATGLYNCTREHDRLGAEHCIASHPTGRHRHTEYEYQPHHDPDAQDHAQALADRQHSWSRP